jgi:hypothetical protein
LLLQDAVLDRYDRSNVVGRGSYGVVHQARERDTGDACAIKKIKGVFQCKSDAKRTLRELAILRSCNHQCVVTLRDIIAPPVPDFKDLQVSLSQQTVHFGPIPSAVNSLGPPSADCVRLLPHGHRKAVQLGGTGRAAGLEHDARQVHALPGAPTGERLSEQSRH